jgi:hypothetical protein
LPWFLARLHGPRDGGVLQEVAGKNTTEMDPCCRVWPIAVIETPFGVFKSSGVTAEGDIAWIPICVSHG